MATPERLRDIRTKEVAVILHQCSLHHEQYEQHKGGRYFIQVQKRQIVCEATQEASSCGSHGRQKCEGVGLRTHDLLGNKERKEDSVGKLQDKMQSRGGVAQNQVWLGQ